jgi:hypothetical protein
MFDPNNPHMPDMSQAEDYVCERCSCPFFDSVMAVKRLSALLSPTGQQMLIPQPVFRCAECKFVNRSQFEIEE